MKTPPKAALYFFRWFCHPDLKIPIEGDLMELYDERVEAIGKRKADWKFIKDVLLLFRRDIIKPTEGTYRLNIYGMIKNYFKVTLRSMLRQKLYSSINIGGLVLGLTSFITISLYIIHEYSYDRFLPNSDRIYRVINRQSNNNFLGKNNYAVTPAPLPSAMMETCPEVAYATAIDDYHALLSPNQSNQHFWEYGLFGDRNFFNVFPYEFTVGDRSTAFENKNSIVLTESLALKISNGVQIIGESINLDGNDFVVTGIMKDVPVYSSMQFNFVANLEADDGFQSYFHREKWSSNSYRTFFSIHNNSTITDIEEKLGLLLEKNWVDLNNYPQHYMVEPLSSIHLRSDVNFDIGTKGNRQQLTIFSITAILILILACTNYTNLAIARSMKRTKEVGLRKVIGARRYQLTFQFLSESLILAFISLFLALMITPFILPEFNELIDRKISMNLLENSFLIPGLLIITVIIGVLSGSYPAIFMASLRPIKSLKGKLGRNSKGNRLQKSLIIAQYAVSIGMIICSVIIYQQFQFIQKKDLGFDKDQIITVRLRGSEIRSSVDVVKQELLSNPNIISVTRSQNLPTHLAQSTIVNDDRGGDPADDLDIYQLRADQDFLNVFGIELLAGEYFSAATLKNQNAPVCLINETAASAMGWSIEEAATQKFTEDWNRGDRKIIGVVKDFHMHSMHLPIAPLLIEPIRPNRGRYLSIKVRPENLKGTLNFIEKNIKQHSPYPYESRFLDDHFNDLYKDDLKQSEIFLVFTILAILIASLGLFGLAAFHINERLKEVSIRKVLGASVRSITLLFSLKFLRLVFWGFLIAIPVSIAAASYWLEFFTYRVDIEWWIFVTVGAAVASIAFFTVGIQSVKAAIANPVESLKDE